jgi:hypothetical protein
MKSCVAQVDFMSDNPSVNMGIHTMVVHESLFSKQQLLCAVWVVAGTYAEFPFDAETDRRNIESFRVKHEVIQLMTHDLFEEHMKESKAETPYRSGKGRNMPKIRANRPSQGTRR